MKPRRSEEVFMQLLKGSVTGTTGYRTFEPLSKKEWGEVYRLAKMHGMVSVLMRELEKLPKESRPPMNMLMFWLGQAAYRETIYEQQLDLSCEFAAALANEGVKCLVLKGLAVGSYYPVEKAREFGDLDCFLIKEVETVKNVKDGLGFDDNNTSFDTLSRSYAFAFSDGNEIAGKMGASVEQSGYKHTHIHYNDLLIENHEFLTNFAETSQGVLLEKTLRALSLEDGCTRIGDTNLWIPKPEFNVLFLLKHSLGDFIANDMSIKAIYDWAVFLKAEQYRIDWKRIEKLLDECRLHYFFDLMTEAAMLYFGLTLYSTGTNGISITSHSRMVDWMMEDVLDMPVLSGKKTLLVKAKRIIDRTKRMIKYHPLLTERIRTMLWTTFRYRGVQKVQWKE